jgi:hypothetical protein
MAEAPSSTINPRRLLQLQSSSPTFSLVAFNFNPLSNPRLLQTLVAFHFPNPVAFLFPLLLLDSSSVLDGAVAR